MQNEIFRLQNSLIEITEPFLDISHNKVREQVMLALKIAWVSCFMRRWTIFTCGKGVFICTTRYEHRELKNYL